MRFIFLKIKYILNHQKSTHHLGLKCYDKRSLNFLKRLSGLFIFSWRIIALQNFVGFCQTSTLISQRHAYDIIRTFIISFLETLWCVEAYKLLSITSKAPNQVSRFSYMYMKNIMSGPAKFLINAGRISSKQEPFSNRNRLPLVCSQPGVCVDLGSRPWTPLSARS